MWLERDAGEAGGRESFDGAVRGCCRVVALVMTRRVKLRVIRGQDRSRHGATEHANFSKWDIDFMLRP
jgi:xanthine dehydrogenase molybdopterin-binding subunit B